MIITDHHEPDDVIPDAYAIINPKQPDCHSGIDYLAGVGVAFYLVLALRKTFRDKGLWQDYPEPAVSEYLDLFTIGTIGDMVPLVGDKPGTVCGRHKTHPKRTASGGGFHGPNPAA